MLGERLQCRVGAGYFVRAEVFLGAGQKLGLVVRVNQSSANNAIQVMA
jgi:hypothetical protein